MQPPDIHTLGALREAGHKTLPVKEEIRRNLIQSKRDDRTIFTGVVGYDHTVLPQIENALLAKHDLLLLGLRGQAKTRLLRCIIHLLDEWIPVIQGSPLQDDPYQPISKMARRLLQDAGDETPIDWLHREQRYNEKLATPDVSIADLIGDIDPIKASRDQLTFADEEVIHYGIIPRTHRGIFALNELPDLQPRIQVGLLNILEEQDFQIRGFPVRLPIDLLMVFSANPEDYTNRGNIITPLKDRIASQILTHYPKNRADAIQITDQEAWTDRGFSWSMPPFYRDIIEQVAIEARKSEFVDQSSGVSARLSISSYESLISNLERRFLAHDEPTVVPRIIDLHALVPSVSGKIELVYEGEQQGADQVARHIIGRAVKTVFEENFPNVASQKLRDSKESSEEQTVEKSPVYESITRWFSSNNRVEIADSSSYEEYLQQLSEVDGLKEVASQFLQLENEDWIGCGMEFVLEGLYQSSFVAKETLETSTFYSDMLMRMFDGMGGGAS